MLDAGWIPIGDGFLIKLVKAECEGAHPFDTWLVEGDERQYLVHIGDGLHYAVLVWKHECKPFVVALSVNAGPSWRAAHDGGSVPFMVDRGDVARNGDRCVVSIHHTVAGHERTTHGPAVALVDTASLRGTYGADAAELGPPLSLRTGVL